MVVVGREGAITETVSTPRNANRLGKVESIRKASCSMWEGVECSSKLQNPKKDKKEFDEHSRRWNIFLFCQPVSALGLVTKMRD